MKEFIKRIVKNVVSIWAGVGAAVTVLGLLLGGALWPLHIFLKTGNALWCWWMIITIPMSASGTYELIMWLAKRKSIWED